MTGLMRRRGFAPLWELNFGYQDADTYVHPANGDLFRQVFVEDAGVVRGITDWNRCYLIGDGGSGKTAYAVHFCTDPGVSGIVASRFTMVDADYARFAALKKNGDVVVSDYQNFWSAVLLEYVAEHLLSHEPESAPGVWVRRALRSAVHRFIYAYDPQTRYLEKTEEGLDGHIQSGFGALGAGIGASRKVRSKEVQYREHLTEAENRLKEALRRLCPSKKHLIFVDGTDVRSTNVSAEDYYACVQALVSAVWNVNDGFLQARESNLANVKIMLLVRPQIFWHAGIAHRESRLRDNSVFLDWNTKYAKWRKSQLFKVADALLQAAQPEGQECNRTLGAAWDHYFPYKVHNYHTGKEDDPAFIPFLRNSFYHPKDIVAFLTILRDNVLRKDQRRETFLSGDFEASASAFANHLEGEVLDQLQYYEMPGATREGQPRFGVIRTLFHHLGDVLEWNRHHQFTYEEFVEAHKAFQAQYPELPKSLDDVHELLQLLYDLNVIGYLEEAQGREASATYWCFSERSQSMPFPSVPCVPGTRYVVHRGLVATLLGAGDGGEQED